MVANVTAVSVAALTEGSSAGYVGAVEMTALMGGMSNAKVTSVEISVLMSPQVDRPSHYLRLGPSFGGVPLPYEESGVIDYFNVFGTCEVCFCPDFQPSQPPLAGLIQPTLTEPPTGGVPPQP